MAKHYLEQISSLVLASDGTVYSNLLSFRAPVAGTLEKIEIYTAVDLTSAATFDVNKSAGYDGALSTLFSNPADRPVVPVGDRKITKSGLSVSVANGDLFTLDVDASTSIQAMLPVVIVLTIEDGIAGGSTAARQTSCNAFGDSVTEFGGIGASDLAHEYFQIICTAKGWTANNQAQGFAFTLDQIDNVYATTIGYDGEQSVYQVGLKDAHTWTTDAVRRAVFQQAHRTSIAWLALPEGRNKYNARNSAFATTGSGWINSTNAHGIGKGTNAAGETATFKVFGTSVYIGYVAQVGSAAGFSVTIDGVAVDAISCNITSGTNIGTNLDSGRNYAPALARYGGLDNKEHTVVLTKTGASDYAIVDWVAGNGDVRGQAPIVYVGTITRFSASAYSTYGGSLDNTAYYSRLVKENVELLRGDGLQAVLVDATGTVDPNTEMVDGVHPNDAGHAKLASAYLYQMDTLPLVVPAPPASSNQAGGTVSDGDKGDITVSASGTVWTIDNGAVATAKIPDKGVTFAKIQDINTSILLGRSSSGTGAVESIGVGSGLSLSGGTLSATGGGGGGSNPLADMYGFPATPPVVADWTVYKPSSAGTETLTQRGNFVDFVFSHTNVVLCFLTRPVSSGSYTVTAAIKNIAHTATGQFHFTCGIFVMDSTNKSQQFAYFPNDSDNFYIQNFNAGSQISNAATGLKGQTKREFLMFLRIVGNGTNRLYQYSVDGRNWYTLSTIAAAAFYTGTVDRAGVFINLNQSGIANSGQMQIVGFSIT